MVVVRALKSRFAMLPAGEAGDAETADEAPDAADDAQDDA